MKTVTISLGRTLQIVDYKDTIRYDVTLATPQHPAETDAALVLRAQQETVDLYKQVEAMMLQAAESADHDTPVNDHAPLNPVPTTPAVRKAPPPRSR